MTNEELENLKRLALAIAEALDGFSDCGAERHFPREKLDEVRRAWAALCEFDHPAENPQSPGLLVSDERIRALLTDARPGSDMLALAREVEAWRWSQATTELADVALLDQAAYSGVTERLSLRAELVTHAAMDRAIKALEEV